MNTEFSSKRIAIKQIRLVSALVFIFLIILNPLFVIAVFATQYVVIDPDPVARDCSNVGFPIQEGDECFNTIQEAIDAAEDGDTIEVTEGTYYENIIIDKEITLQGAGANITVIDGGGERVIDIVSENVSIRGFTIQNGPEHVEDYHGSVYIHPLECSENNPITMQNNVVINGNRARALFIDDQRCSNVSSERINIQNNEFHDGVFIESAYQARISHNYFTKNVNSDSMSRGLTVIGPSQSITIDNNTFDRFLGTGGVGITINSSGGVTDIEILNNTFSHFTGNMRYAIELWINGAILPGDMLANVSMQNNVFDTITSPRITAIRGIESDDPDYQLIIDATDNDFGTEVPQERENMIDHHCSAAIDRYAGHNEINCNNQDNNAREFLIVKHSNLAEPENLGWNLASESTTPDEGNPEGLDIPCFEDEIVYVNENSLAHNWSGSSNEQVQFLRQWMVPGETVWTNDHNNPYQQNYTGFVTFGGTPGIEGLWHTRVRAWIDANENQEIDVPDEVSEWSSVCTIVYDITAPVITLQTYAINDPTPELVGSIDDPEATIEIIIDNQAYQPVIRTDGSWEIPDNIIPPLTDGTYLVDITATDRAGNQTHRNENLVIDTTAPELILADIKISEIVTAIPEPQILTNPEKLPLVCSPVSLADLQLLPGEEQKDVAVSCNISDHVGNRAYDEYVISVLNNAPTVSINTSDYIEVVESTPITLDAEVQGGNVVTAYEWSGDCTGDTPSITTTFSMGIHSCTVTVYDEDLDTSSDSITIRVNKKQLQNSIINNSYAAEQPFMNTSEPHDILAASDEQSTEDGTIEKQESEVEIKEQTNDTKFNALWCIFPLVTVIAGVGLFSAKHKDSKFL